MDEIDVQDLSDNIIDATLDTLAQQQDETQQQTTSGRAEINPQTFTFNSMGADRRTMVQGPIMFESAFNKMPDVTFGQIGRVDDNDDASGNVALNVTPFLVQPFVYKWVTTNGVFDGFWLGLYALTPPGNNGTSHIVTWQATGDASRYKDEDPTDSWVQGYDLNDADYLTDETGETENANGEIIDTTDD